MQTIGNANGLPHSLFISDLHLCHSRPAITLQFVRFLQTTAINAQALYVLGDLFEYWAGDDDIHDAHHQQVIHSFKVLSSAGTQLFFMHGNRDFLIAETFAEAGGISLLADPTLLTLYGKRILLSHGDMLCTDDVAYQEFRKQVRNSAWQNQFLKQPLDLRKRHIETLRQRSEQEKSSKSAGIMDVNAGAVEAIIRQFEYPELLIHGHTHRPAQHLLKIDGHHCERWVLGDWYEQGSCLRLDQHGVSKIALND